MWKPDPVLELTEEEQVHPTLRKLPSIVVVIDEFADMMMIVGKKVEELIARSPEGPSRRYPSGAGNPAPLRTSSPV